MMRRVGIAVAMALVLSGCGGVGAVVEDLAGDENAVEAEPTTTSAPAGREVGPPEFFLTGARTDVPSGWNERLARCQGGDQPPGQLTFNYLVPGDWTQAASGAMGSGGPQGSEGDTTYRRPDRSEVKITIVSDNRTDDGVLVDRVGQPFEFANFDRTVEKSSGEKVLVTYEPLAQVSVDGVKADLHRLDQGKFDVLDASEYKFRLRYADVPNPMVDDGRRQDWSSTVTIGWDAKLGALEETEVRAVIESFRLATCAQSEAVSYLKQMFTAMGRAMWPGGDVPATVVATTGGTGQIDARGRNLSERIVIISTALEPTAIEATGDLVRVTLAADKERLSAVTCTLFASALLAGEQAVLVYPDSEHTCQVKGP